MTNNVSNDILAQNEPD